MDGVVKLTAIETLVDIIHTGVPELKPYPEAGGRIWDPVKVVKVPPDQRVKFPCLAIVPSKFRFESKQERIHSEPDLTTAVFDVGTWSCTMQFRIGCATPAERFKMEQKVGDLFMQREGAPGLLMTEAVDPMLGDYMASWELDGTEWDDDLAFSSQHWAVTTFTGTIPALVTRSGQYMINTLKIGLTHDFEAAFTAATFTTSRNLRVVQVDEDGIITPA